MSIAWKPTGGVPRVVSARDGDLRGLAVFFEGDARAYISPIDATLPALPGRSNLVTHIVAPNHFHNLGLARAKSRFPDAKLCCADAARPRLEEVTELSFEGLEDFEAQLPSGITLLQPEGLKTGEIWLRVEGPRETAWVVTEAFVGAMKTLDDNEENEPGISETFPGTGIEDAATYVAWVRAELQRAAPTVLIPCHGAVCRRPNLADELAALLSSLEG